MEQLEKLRVKDAGKYAFFEYEQYHDRFTNEIPKPDKLTYDIGDVVFIKDENAIGVVIGCVSEESGEVRTDMSGMQCFSQIRPATIKDFERLGVRYTKTLADELFIPLH